MHEGDRQQPPAAGRPERPPRRPPGTLVVYLDPVHLTRVRTLVVHMVDAIDDHHGGSGGDGHLLRGTHELRAELVETLDRLDEARRRGQR